jgi:hypothetical protein
VSSSPGCISTSCRDVDLEFCYCAMLVCAKSCVMGSSARKM